MEQSSRIQYDGRSTITTSTSYYQTLLFTNGLNKRTAEAKRTLPSPKIIIGDFFGDNFFLL